MHGEVLNRHYTRDGLPDGDGAERLRVALSVASRDAVGCKLHACQPDPGWDRWETAWDYLASDPAIKVIHLYRQSLLAQLASWKIADLLDRWGDQTDVVERPVIRIDPGELVWFHRWNELAYRVRLTRLRRHAILTVAYEDLRDQWQATLERVLRFIGVEPRPLAPCAKQCETRPLREVISNYHELIKGA